MSTHTVLKPPQIRHAELWSMEVVIQHVSADFKRDEPAMLRAEFETQAVA